MTDKEKIRKEVQKIARSINPYIPDEEGKNSEYEAGRFAMVTQIMQIIDSLQEEPKTDWLQELQNKLDSLSKEDFKKVWGKYGAEEKEEPVSEGLEEYINELSKQFPEVSFAKLSRIAVRVANWQKAKVQETIETAIHHAYNNGKLEMKEQMIAKAVDGHATFEFYGLEGKTYGTIAHDPICFEDFDIKDSDKVKMILIKEE